jgi:hypothetical protein
MLNSIAPLNPATATREEMRSWISSSARTLATHLHGSPTISSLREVMKTVGFASLSAVIAEGTMEALRTCVTKLTEQATTLGLLMADTAPAPLPPPPSRITVFLDEVDDASALADEAADLARRAAEAAARAKAAAATPRPAAGLTPADAERLDKVEAKFKSLDIDVGVNTANILDLRSSAIATRDKVDAIESKLAPLAAVLDAITGSGSAPSLPPAAVVAVKAAVSGDRLLSEVLPFFTPGIPQGNQIPCVASPPSFGKTFMSDEISRLYDGSFFHPFKDSLDEIDSLVGTLMPRSDGTFAVIDGPLVSAARLASTGVNTLFVGDEVFNASKKTLEWMQSFLSPRLVPYVGTDGVESLRRCFVIQTKHSMEDGTFEVIKAPEECLHFLFLGNLRTNPPEALMSRCRLMRFDYDPKWAAETALQRLEQYGYGLFTGTEAEEWAGRWAKAMTASREAYSRMEVSRPLCFRFLIGAITHVARQPDASLTKLSQYVAKWAPHQIAVQNAATQDTDVTSAGVVKKIISASFGI